MIEEKVGGFVGVAMDGIVVGRIAEDEAYQGHPNLAWVEVRQPEDIEFMGIEDARSLTVGVVVSRFWNFTRQTGGIR